MNYCSCPLDGFYVLILCVNHVRLSQIKFEYVTILSQNVLMDVFIYLTKRLNYYHELTSPTVHAHLHSWLVFCPISSSLFPLPSSLYNLLITWKILANIWGLYVIFLSKFLFHPSFQLIIDQLYYMVLHMFISSLHYEQQKQKHLSLFSVWYRERFNKCVKQTNRKRKYFYSECFD